MTVFINFVPVGAPVSPPFQAQITLDGQSYNLTSSWNLFGQRWYINVTALDGTIVVSRALVGSPTGQAIQSLTWDQGRAVATTLEPHGYRVGKVLTLTISGASPATYNGRIAALVTGPSTFTYAISADPDAATVAGVVSYDIDLVGGYFSTSTLIYRQPANQFEVSP